MLYFLYDEVRLAVVDKFPYAAHYIVDGTLVKIQAVLAFKQNPDNNWITRFWILLPADFKKNSPNNIRPYHRWLQNELKDKLVNKRK